MKRPKCKNVNNYIPGSVQNLISDSAKKKKKFQDILILGGLELFCGSWSF